MLAAGRSSNPGGKAILTINANLELISPPQDSHILVKRLLLISCISVGTAGRF